MTPHLQKLRALEAVLNYARATSAWIVVVAQEANVANAHFLLHVIAPRDAQHAGRSLLLPGGGRVTVTSQLHEVHGKDFHVFFIDGETTSNVQDAIHSPAWRSKSLSVLMVDEHEESLVAP